jgi:hypothetical protein
MAQINKGYNYSTSNSLVTIDNLNQHVGDATLNVGSITDQATLLSNANPATARIAIADSGLLKQATVDQAVGGVLADATNGDLLIGNTTTTRFAKAKLTAGSGIAVTNGAGSVAIATLPAGSFLAAAYSGTQTITLTELTALSGYFKYTLGASSYTTIVLPQTSKRGAVFNFNVYFSTSSNIIFKATTAGTVIVGASASSGVQTFTLIALQDNPTSSGHWGSFN